MPIISERSELMRSAKFSAVLIFAFVPAFLFGQTNSSTLPENVAALTSSTDANGSALPQPAQKASQLLPDSSRPSSRANVDIGGMALSSLPSDTTWSGDPRFTVSVSSLATPERARKAFSKGEEDERKGDYKQPTTILRRRWLHILAMPWHGLN